jgi:hydroxyacylglutathione hydrolase
MILEKIVVGPLEVNCYILGCPRTFEAVVIDPGAEPEKIKKRLKNRSLKIKFIVNTHGHGDHIGANAQLSAPIYVHRLDAEFLSSPQLNLSGMFGCSVTSPLPAGLLEQGQLLQAGSISLTVIHTPGHTPGGICLNAGDCIFTGDTLFAQGIGRTDIPGASQQDLLQSIKEKLFALPDEAAIYPGHGPASSIGKEKRNNPFI